MMLELCFCCIILDERRISLESAQMPTAVPGLGDLFQKRISEAVPASLGAHPCGRWAKERCTSHSLQRKSPTGFDGYPHSLCLQLLNT